MMTGSVISSVWVLQQNEQVKTWIFESLTSMIFDSIRPLFSLKTIRFILPHNPFQWYLAILVQLLDTAIIQSQYLI